RGEQGRNRPDDARARHGLGGRQHPGQRGAARVDRYRPHAQCARRGRGSRVARAVAHAVRTLGRPERFRGDRRAARRAGLAVHHRNGDPRRRRLFDPGLREEIVVVTHHELAPSPETVHWGFFDAALPGVHEVYSGDTLTIDPVSGWAEVVDPARISAAHAEILEKVRPGPGPHILTGPVHVRGALPGDALEVRIRSIELTVDWGWNVIRPLRGTLPEDFPYFQKRLIPIDRERMVAPLPWGPQIPLQPFFGIVATAPRDRKSTRLN